MRIEQSYIQRCKAVAHGLQALMVFIAGCIMLAVFTKEGSTGSPSKYYFAMCFFTIPALIYQVMVPLWTRAVKFANAYAFAAVDVLYTIFWFAAFISVATWNAAGIRQGAKDRNIDKDSGNCTTFAYGTEGKCKLSRATVGFGIVIFLLFLLTSAISAYYLIKFRKDGTLPVHAHGGATNNPQTLEAGNKDAWSANVDELEHDADEGTQPHRSGSREDDEYALLHSTETYDGRHPGRPLSWGEDRTGSVGDYGRTDEYGDGYEDYRKQSPPRAASPGGYDEYRKGNYSFSGGNGAGR
ncbi:hypothetical protein H2201_006385 [Coniosporium apollinis]|uniref:MARVEL domain-containing protein n=1 Tax=Coniosporium apollinis TaxID=61459 RepID=A0ABQ9NM77_9PEZI|nr:hypothetical protein H2201_006385 [Coniosporium apollinis]